MQRYLIILLLLLLFIWISLEADNPVEVNGYFKNFSILLVQPRYQVGEDTRREPDLGAVNNRLRIQVSFKPLSWLSLQSAYDLSPRIQDARLFQSDAFSPGFEPAGYRFDDFSQQLYPGSGTTPESFAVHHNLDRFFLTVKLKRADIFLGRQAIAWGSARIINPTDIIAPFSFNELDTEERRGVDAIRVRIPLGMMDELDLGVVAGEDFSRGKNAFFLRSKTYLLKTDLSLILMGFREHLMIGFDLSRAVGGASAWMEAAYVSPDFFNSEEENPDPYFRISLGLDYNLRGGYYVFAEYHYSSAGESQAENYLNLLESPAFRDGSVYLMGRHYLGAGITKQITGLITATGFLLANLSDGSFSLSPQAEYNIANNIYLSAGAYIGIGKSPEMVLGPLVENPTLFHSEFGAYPDMVYFTFRIYF